MPVARLAVLLAAAYWTVAVTASFEVAEHWRALHGLRLSAFATSSWEGRRVLEAIDSSMSNELLGNHPFPAWQVYSLEWNGYLAVREAGLYTFSVRSDDGSTVEVDGVTVMDSGGVHGERTATGQRQLEEGIHAIRVRYFQNGGRYVLSVMWSRDGKSFEPIPAGQLLPDAVGYTAYRLRVLQPIGVAAASLLCFGAIFAGLRRVPWRGLASRLGPALGRWLRSLERPGVAIAVLLGVGAAARFAMLSTTPAILWPDSQVFYVTMRDILDGMWASHDAYRTLAYPYFLAAFLKWSASPAVGTLVIVTQQELGLLAVVLFYLVGRRAFTPLVAFAGALLLAVHAVQLFYEMTVLSETLFTVSLALTLWLAVRAYDHPTIGRAAALGLVAVLLVLVRPVAQWFIYCLLGVGVFATQPGRQRLTAAAMVVACYGLPLVLWMSVNQREYGFFGVSLGRGMGLYTRVFDIDGMVPPEPSQHPEMRELWATAKMLRWSPNRVRDELNYGRHFSSAKADDLMFAFTLETLAAHPWAYAAGTVRQWIVQVVEPQSGVRTCPSPTGRYLCSGRTDTESLPPFPNTPPPAAPWLRRTAVLYITEGLVRMKVVATFAAIGVAGWLWWPRRNAAGALLALTAFYFTLIPSLLQVHQDRFRLPVDVILFMFAVWGVSLVAARWPLGPNGPSETAGT